MALLDLPGSAPSLVLLQYDLASPYNLILRQIVQDALDTQMPIIFVSLLLSPLCYLDQFKSPLLHLCDFSRHVPGYSDETPDVLLEIQSKISSAKKGPVLLIIDSPDTLLADTASQSRTLDSLSRAFGQIVQRSPSSRLVLPVRSGSALLPFLLSTSFQARMPRSGGVPHTLANLVLHPTTLFVHLTHHYHLSLPPLSTPPDAQSARFWSVFASVASRGMGERLVIGIDVDGGVPESNNQSTTREPYTGVVELVTRTRSGGQKGVRRVLRGWRLVRAKDRVAWCNWEDIPALKSCTASDIGASAPAPSAIESVSFNLQLSDTQQQARASVPLPYVSDGLQAYGSSQAQGGEIHYIPDQADDFDDDDPDDDLYI